MTEQAFRTALHRAAENDGLSSECQLRVLARMKGDEPKVKMKNKWIIALALVVVLSLGMTAAVAAGLGGVDWNGDPALPPENKPLSGTELGDAIIPHFTPFGTGTMKVRAPLDQEQISLGFSESTVNFVPESIEEMKASVIADGSLPWPTKLPEGYTFKEGRVAYMCSETGGMKEISNAITEDGFFQVEYELPTEKRFMSNYFLNLVNEAGEEIVIHVQSEYGNYLAYSFMASDDSKVTKLDIDGTTNALFIDSPDRLKLALRRPLAEPKIAYYMDFYGYYMTGQPWEMTHTFETMVIVINATVLTENDLLSVFGLTVK